jgi:hypothetical protein
MRKGKTLVELATELERQQDSKRDFVSPASKVRTELEISETSKHAIYIGENNVAEAKDAIRLREATSTAEEEVALATKLDTAKAELETLKGNAAQAPVLRIEGVENNGSGTFPITTHARGQLAAFCDVPKVYHDRLLTEDPELLVENLNRRLDHYGTKGRMVRTLDGSVRALLSDRYRPLDNFDLMEAILPVLTETPGLRVESCDVTTTRLYIKAVTEKVEYSLAEADWEGKLEGHEMIGQEFQEAVQAGIVISNSEIGAGSVRIEPMLFFLACLNGMIVPDSSLRKYHVGRSTMDLNNAQEMFRDETRRTDDAAFWMKVRDVVSGSFNQIDFEKMVSRVAATKMNRIDTSSDPVKVIEVTAKKFGFSETERTGVLTEFLKRGEMTQFGVQAAVTKHSQDVREYDRATELERIGGKVIELPQQSWKEIAQAA